MTKHLDVLSLFLAAAGLIVACVVLRSDMSTRENLRTLERAVAEQRDALKNSDEQRMARNRWFNLCLRAQESFWYGADGSPLLVRIATESDDVKAGTPVRLIVEVRNNSDREQIVSVPSFQPYD